MFERKKGRSRIHESQDPSKELSSINARRQPTWAAKIIFNFRPEANLECDEFDERQCSFFDCPQPSPEDSCHIFKSGELLPPTGQPDDLAVIDHEEKTLSVFDQQVDTTKPGSPYHFLLDKSKLTPNPVKSSPKEIEVIELSDDSDENATEMDSDDDILMVGQVKGNSGTQMSALTARRKERKNLEKLDAHLAKFGRSILNVEERTTKGNYEIGHDFDGALEEVYLEVAKNMTKLTFMLRDDDPTHIPHLIDPRESREQEIAEEGEEEIPSRPTSPDLSDIDVEALSSEEDSNDEMLITKKPPSKNTSLSPSGGAKGQSFKTSPPATEAFAPKKENKLRAVNLSDMMPLNDMAIQKERQAMRKREQKKKDEECLIIDPPTKFKIPKKVVVSDPSSTTMEPAEVTEPIKKKTRVDPVEPTRDILGTITDAMDAHRVPDSTKDINPDDMSPRKHRDEEWVMPSYHEEPIVRPPLPSRFGSDIRDDDNMDIESPDGSPKADESPLSSDNGIEEMRKERLDESTSPSVTAQLNTHTNAVNVYLLVTVPMRYLFQNQFPLGDNSDGATSQNLSRYLFKEVDGKKIFPVSTRLPMEYMRENTREIPLEKKELNQFDPRLPVPSPNTVSKWNTPVGGVLDIDETTLGEGAIMEKIRKEKEVGSKEGEKRRGVKWGENQMKEFDVHDDDEIKVIEPEKKKEKETEIIGEKEVGGKKYRIVKKKVAEPVATVPVVPAAPPKSCLKTTIPSDRFVVPPYLSTVVPPSYQSSIPSRPPLPPLSSLPLKPSIPPPRTPPISPSSPSFDQRKTPLLPAPNLQKTAIPKLANFMPPPGYETEKKKEAGGSPEVPCLGQEGTTGQSMGMTKNCSGSEMRIEDRATAVAAAATFKVTKAVSSSSVINTGGTSGTTKGIGGEKKGSEKMAMGGGEMKKGTERGTGPQKSLVNRNIASRPFERGSITVGRGVHMRAYKKSDIRVRQQMELKTKMAMILNVHKTLKNKEEEEYPVMRGYPSCEEQLRESRRYHKELTQKELMWRDVNIQTVFLHSNSAAIDWPFGMRAGLYWPILQGTDGLIGTEEDFESKDVLRALGNHTHFATEKKSLMGLESRLPNGQTHRERFESFFNSGSKKPEGRFKYRPMFSRVFNTQNEQAARNAHYDRIETIRKNLNEHEKNLRKNAPDHVDIVECRVQERKIFNTFNEGIDYYKDDEYEMDSWEKRKYPDWYSTRGDMYFPYSDRAGYLCEVINSYNHDYNKLYRKLGRSQMPREEKRKQLIALDKTAFTAAQIHLGRMDGWKRVGLSQEAYLKLLNLQKERKRMMEAPSFSVNSYAPLCTLNPFEYTSFHVIIDWISSIFHAVQPISQWKLDSLVNDSFRAIIINSNVMDRMGNPRSKRELFYEAFLEVMKSSKKGPPRKKQRIDHHWDGYQ
ncbi:hypothetical protein PFISCL1PPCAC_2107 [Pristionchus fissidentatus]|uniref:Uncharacterized protein n=1 Tax=Pristionchus fissidentatus TaxID=1538716 RepID=A0AAV5UXA1_9BILA|nr:hypothetical protein PFISCL1PPCAC_2107 [Pristionchus fissidentatus]